MTVQEQSFLVDDLNDEIESDIAPGLDYSGLSISALDFSVETLATQIRDGNIDVSPGYQRRDAWNDEKRSRFIESLILHVPIPQVVLAERTEERGRYYVLDGRQRLMTLASIYYDDHSRWRRAEFQKLYNKEYLNGISLNAFRLDPRYVDDFRAFRNAPIRCSVLTGYKSDDVLYDIFFRLNSGSVPLTGQELRQVVNRGPFTQFLFDVTDVEGAPIQLVLRIPGPDPRFADCEILLRQLALMMRIIPYGGNMKAFLDSAMTNLNLEWNELHESASSEYDLVNAAILALGELIGFHNVGRKILGDGRFEPRFNKAVFEVEIFYFGELLRRGGLVPDGRAFLDGFTALCSDPEFVGSVESTTKSLDRFGTRFSKFKVMMERVLGEPLDIFPYVRGA